MTPRSLFPLSPAALAVKAVCQQAANPPQPAPIYTGLASWQMPWGWYTVTKGAAPRSIRVRFRGASTADDVLPIEVFTE